jgi:enediyne biosynthesis protein E4
MTVMKKSAITELAAALALLAAASAAQAQDSAASPSFVDVTAASGISYQVGFTRPALIDRGDLSYQVSIMTYGGVAAGDCDGDGDIDLFITYGNTRGPNGGGGPNRLYLNQLAEQGNGLLFEDVAERAGVANTRLDGKGNDRHSGPAFADMDGDGDLDLFLGGVYSDPDKIYENQGDCTFRDVTSNSPDIEHMRASHTISAGFGDYDLDGDLDMFLTHWATSDNLYEKDGVRRRQTDHLFRNDSDESGIRFVNVSEDSGISDVVWLTRTYPGTYNFPFSEQDFDFTFTPTFARINDDVWPDIAIAADFGTTQVAINNGDGTFHSLENRILREAQFGMGSALGDIDNDGDLDWFVTSIRGPGTKVITPHGNRLFTNNGTASMFTDDTEKFGVADGSFGWGTCFIDIDDDSDLDIYHTNGFPEPFLTQEDEYYSDASRLFVMNKSGKYDEEAQARGLAVHTEGRGVVCADFDHDGDTDILELTDSAGNSAKLWENRTAAAGRHFLRVRLEGAPPNTQAAGARIHVRVGDKDQMREITVGSNYTSQNPTVQVFGLDAATAVDEILVEWPAIISTDGPKQLGTLLNGPIAASKPGETLVIRHPELPQG